MSNGNSDDYNSAITKKLKKNTIPQVDNIPTTFVLD